MMQPFSVVGLFCEDIREEKSGQETLVGVMPHNLSFPSVPGVLPKLSLYIRINFDPNSDPGEIDTKIVMPDQQSIDLGIVDRGVIEDAKKEAQEQGKPIAGVIATSTIAPFTITELGMIRAIVTIQGEEHLCALLRIIPA
jgi:hypothetical protein